MTQVGIAQVSMAQVGISQLGTAQVSLTQVGIAQVGLTQIDSFQVSPYQMASLKSYISNTTSIQLPYVICDPVRCFVVVPLPKIINLFLISSIFQPFFLSIRQPCSPETAQRSLDSVEFCF